ncbi:MAG TPA: SDR family NAD(P)-dependent oxidoreductase [Bacilli bacterium]|nr:SDR family NAD(P)-dependent oxidoreductase [Bacilli bacterium]
MNKKTVIITNARRWLSIKMIKRYLAEGYQVIAIDESNEATDEFIYFNESAVEPEKKISKISWTDLKNEGVICFQGQLTDELFASRLINYLTNNNISVNTLVMYPSIFQEKDVADLTQNDIDAFYSELIAGPVGFLKQILPLLRQSKGNVELISSALAINPEPVAPLYSILEAALVMLVKCLTITEKNVRFNSVLVGPAFTETLLSVYDEQELLNEYIKYIPANKLVLLDDIVEQTLCHTKCVSCYGSLATVDGGESHANVYSYIPSLMNKTQTINEVHVNNEKKAVLVTGGSSGIGLVTAKKFLAEGWQVYVLDINECPLPDVTSLIADVRNISEIENAFKAIPKLDVLVNCAGIYRLGFLAKGNKADFRENITEDTYDSVNEITLNDLKNIFKVNVFGYLLVIKYALSLLKASQGNIVLVSSGLGDKPEPTSILYCMTKAAINSMVRCLADSSSLIDARIKINGVLPGPVDTPLLINAFGSKDNAQAYYDYYNPMGIIVNPEEVAESIYFYSVLSSATGTLANIDGGEGISTGHKKLSSNNLVKDDTLIK